MPEKHRNKGRPRAFDRDEALEKAMLLFWRNGYEGTSISQLTTSMGIAAPSLYAAFGSKEHLYREALQFYVRTLGDLGVVQLAGASSAREGVRGVLLAAAEAFTRPDAPAGCMVGVGSLRVAQDTAMAAEAASQLRAHSNALLRDRIQRAQLEGEIPATPSPEALTDFFATVLEGMSIAAIDGTGPERLRTLAELAMAAWPVSRGGSRSTRHLLT